MGRGSRCDDDGDTGFRHVWNPKPKTLAEGVYGFDPEDGFRRVLRVPGILRFLVEGLGDSGMYKSVQKRCFCRKSKLLMTMRMKQSMMRCMASRRIMTPRP